MANLDGTMRRQPSKGDGTHAVRVLGANRSRGRTSIRVRTTGFTQDGKIVIEFLRTFMVYKRGHVPVRATIPEPKR